MLVQRTDRGARRPRRPHIPRRLAPHEQHLLPSYGLGITNLVARATARADELSPEEFRAGADRLRGLLEEINAHWTLPAIAAEMARLRPEPSEPE